MIGVTFCSGQKVLIDSDDNDNDVGNDDTNRNDIKTKTNNNDNDVGNNGTNRNGTNAFNKNNNDNDMSNNGIIKDDDSTTTTAIIVRIQFLHS